MCHMLLVVSEVRVQLKELILKMGSFCNFSCFEILKITKYWIDIYQEIIFQNVFSSKKNVAVRVVTSFHQLVDLCRVILHLTIIT